MKVYELLERLPQHVRNRIWYFRDKREEGMRCFEISLNVMDKKHQDMYRDIFESATDKLRGYLLALKDVGMITDEEREQLISFGLSFGPVADAENEAKQNV